MAESQTSRFITFFRESLKARAEQPVTEVEAQLEPSDLALIEQFIEHLEGAQQGRAEREADPNYQAELEGPLSSLLEQIRLQRGAHPA